MQRQGLQSKLPGARGFTLVELLVVLSVFAVLLGLAAPSFMNIIANNRVASTASDLVTLLNLGKSEAIRSGQTIVLCKKDSSNQCDTDTSGDWSKGWLLFVDEDEDNSVDADERIIRVASAPADNLNPIYNGSGGNNRLINFKPNGRTSPNGRFCLNNSHDDAKSRAVSVSLSGRFQSVTRAYGKCNSPP